MLHTANDNNHSDQAKVLFEVLFGNILSEEKGEIEIRAFLNNPLPGQSSALTCTSSTFHDNIDDAVMMAYELSNQGHDTYFGINPRIGSNERDESVSYAITLHVDLNCESIDEAHNYLHYFDYSPTVVIRSGGGLHLYWLLKEPIRVTTENIDDLNAINKGLAQSLRGNIQACDIGTVLRVPGTFNYKLKDNVREVSIVQMIHGIAYGIDDFAQYKEPITKTVTDIMFEDVSVENASVCIPDIFHESILARPPFPMMM